MIEVPLGVFVCPGLGCWGARAAPGTDRAPQPIAPRPAPDRPGNDAPTAMHMGCIGLATTVAASAAGAPFVDGLWTGRALSAAISESRG